MNIWEQLRHFRSHEFDHPDHIEHALLKLLDELRHVVGIPFIITSDGRDPEHNARVGGVPTSLHLFDPEEEIKCRAVDFCFPASFYRERKSEHYWTITSRLALLVRDRPDLFPSPVQFEIVDSDRDHHFHLGLHRQQQRGNQLVLALD